jgi:hypothetical protein
MVQTAVKALFLKMSGLKWYNLCNAIFIYVATWPEPHISKYSFFNITNTNPKIAPIFCSHVCHVSLLDVPMILIFILVYMMYFVKIDQLLYPDNCTPCYNIDSLKQLLFLCSKGNFLQWTFITMGGCHHHVLTITTIVKFQSILIR